MLFDLSAYAAELVADVTQLLVVMGFTGIHHRRGSLVCNNRNLKAHVGKTEPGRTRAVQEKKTGIALGDAMRVRAKVLTDGTQVFLNCFLESACRSA